MIRIKKFVFNPFAENTFVLWDEDTLEAAVIDPGCFNEIEERELKNFIDTQKLKVKHLLNTHCHIDHILGCNFISKEYSPVYSVPELDIPLLNAGAQQASAFGIKLKEPLKPDVLLNEESEILIGKNKAKILFTPGHTAGELCFYFDESKTLIAGDVLFQGSIGRTDLWGGDLKTLLHSIRTKLFSLPGNTIVFPGHGSETTIDEEKTYNPFFTVSEQ